MIAVIIVNRILATEIKVENEIISVNCQEELHHKKIQAKYSLIKFDEFDDTNAIIR